MTNTMDKKTKPAGATPQRAPANSSAATGIPAVSWKMLGSLFALAFVVRVIALGRADLWCDEILFVNLSTPPDVTSPLVVFITHLTKFRLFGHMPLPPMFQNIFLLFVSLFQQDIIHNAFLQRIPAALWGSASVPVFLLLALRIMPRHVAWGATSMMLFCFFPVYYAREAYYYAPLLFFVTASLLQTVKIVEGEASGARPAILLAAMLTGAIYSHVSGTAVVISLLLVTGISALVSASRSTGRPHAARFGWIAAACMVAIATAFPFFVKHITGKAILVFLFSEEYSTMFNNVLGTMLLGTRTWAMSIAWPLLAAGIAAGLLPGRAATSRRVVLGYFAICLTIMLVSARQTQYAPRYFTATAPCFYLVFASGLFILFKAASKIYKSDPSKLAGMTCGLIALFHIVYFLPSTYALKSKSANFGGIASWLNANLKPGAPYLMESAYELRFVSGHFPTPGLIPASPYVHGGGVEEMNRLHQAQKDFMVDFPEAPFVESAHHNSRPNGPTGLWTWPAQFYKNKFALENKPFETLAKKGMGLTLYPDATIKWMTTLFYFNRPEDLDTVARENGWPAVFQYPEWRCVALEQTAQGNARYGRMHPGNRGRITVKGTSPSQYGCFQADAAIIAPAGSYSGSLLWKGQPVGTFAMQPSRLMTITSRPVELTDAAGDLQWAATGTTAQQVQALAIAHLRFIPVPGEMQPPAAAEKQ
jgi:hypothetical protein